MRKQFVAKIIALDDLEDYLLLGFADDPNEPENYLMLQRAYEFDDQDKANGMATYCVERNGQGWSTYGGIAQVELGSTSIIFRFDRTGKEALGDIDDLEIEFTPMAMSVGLDNVRTQLARVFEGMPVELKV
jgi:hypothetical protein